MTQAPLSAHAGVVLLYHHVETGTPTSTSISPEKFQRHLEIIEEEGFEVLPLEELVARAQGKADEQQRIVAITFDDAYRSIYSTAWPLLRERGWPFTIFVAPDLVDHNQYYLNWSQLREMSDAGVHIANHSKTHAHFVRRQSGESQEDWKARIAHEIKGAADALESRGFSSNLLAYPYGEYNQDVLSLVAEMGYTAFGQHSGAIGPASHPQLLARFPLAGPYADEDTFRTKLKSLALPVRHPDIEPVVGEDLRPTLRLEFMDDAVIPDRLTCYGPGGQMQIVETTPGKADQPGIAIVQPQADVPVGRSRYNCTMRSDSGRYYWFSQMWIRKRPDGRWYEE